MAIQFEDLNFCKTLNRNEPENNCLLYTKKIGREILFITSDEDV